MAERTIRCAVYTRKSSEDGLDQSFNSLDAQREACSAYVMSQRHEGWVLVPDLYDDGGYSGGSMARPGLQQLLADLEAGKVDVIIVYKVDRLTRSLADFAKIVELLDAKGASFVSVTQAFNTTSSMGRLTLNVLLSFAQFEREVTGERIRDKIAASKQKGMWMGGTVPFGYRAVNRQLVIDEDEAVIIRAAMARYVELRSVRLLADELARQGVRTRAVTLSDGRIRGGVPFGRGGLRHLLQNRLYLGEVEHKGKTWPGEHQPIVTPDLWQEVQDVMRSQSCDHRHGIRARTPSLLSGLLFDGHGRAMSPSHAVKHGKRYRYYITHPRSIAVGDPSAWRLPAHDLEHGIMAQLAGFLSDAAALTDALGTVTDLDRYQAVIASAATAGAALTSAMPGEVREIILRHIVRIDLTDGTLTMTIRIDEGHSHSLTAAHAIVRRGNDVALLVEASTPDPLTRRDEQLVALISDAHAARQAILDAPDQPFDTVASRLGMGIARLKRLLRLASLGPSIVEAILDGTQPDDLTAARLNTLTHIPLDWSAQRTMLGLD